MHVLPLVCRLHDQAWIEQHGHHIYAVTHRNRSWACTPVALNAGIPPCEHICGEARQSTSFWRSLPLKGCRMGVSQHKSGYYAFHGLRPPAVDPPKEGCPPANHKKMLRTTGSWRGCVGLESACQNGRPVLAAIAAKYRAPSEQ